MSTKHIFKALVIASITTFSAQSAAADLTLKLGTTGRLGMPIGDAIDQALIPAMEKASGGEVTIEPYYQKTLCAEQKCGEQANQGLIALWTSSTANYGNFGSELAIFDLPFIFKSLEDAKRISNDWLAERQCKLALENAGHICLSVYSSGGFRQLGNATKSVRVPDDMKGLKWRTTKSPVEFMLVKNWGAVPTPYDWSQLYQGLQSGVVEGQYVASPWQEVAKLHEVAKYFTEIGGMWSGNILAMDSNQYNAMTDQQREWLHQAADAYGEKVNELDNAWIKNGEDIIKASANEWYVPTEDELTQWRAGAIGAWLDAKGTFEPDVARRVLLEQGMDSFVAQLEEAGAL
ncbi:TRAP transporter substrate-binding protein [Amylibacter sp.]|jgi:TRAP-type C4-dicarboxylate transport system substrate-binding protein|nr:TRAP transporter substrate-binding protein [Amylibacter sp.]MDB4132390.1 TRAP transporter substrate-binding protein [Amylibacter sp.]